MLQINTLEKSKYYVFSTIYKFCLNNPELICPNPEKDIGISSIVHEIKSVYYKYLKNVLKNRVLSLLLPNMCILKIFDANVFTPHTYIFDYLNSIGKFIIFWFLLLILIYLLLPFSYVYCILYVQCVQYVAI